MLFAFRLVPLAVRKAIFIALFKLFYHLSPKNRLIALHNLLRSFPEKNTDEIIKIAKDVYRHFAIVAAEFFDMPYINKENIHKWVEIEGSGKFSGGHCPRKRCPFHSCSFWQLGANDYRCSYLPTTNVHSLPSAG